MDYAFLAWFDERLDLNLANWLGDKRIYVLNYEVIKEKIQELIDQGGTQVLLQGGHNPELKIEYYEELFTYIKAEFPQVILRFFNLWVKIQIQLPKL